MNCKKCGEKVFEPYVSVNYLADLENEKWEETTFCLHCVKVYVVFDKEDKFDAVSATADKIILQGIENGKK